MCQIIFAGTGELGEVCLRALQCGLKQIAIVDSNDESILNLKRREDTIIKHINASSCKYVFLAGWYPLIKSTALSEKKYINIHGSLLPKYRGIHSIFWAIMNGEKQLGYTIHEVNKNVDDGDILYQFKFSYDAQTVGEIHDLFYKDLTENLVIIINAYITGKIVPKKQDINEATWVPKRNLDDCKIDFSMSNLMLRRFFLALTEPYPLPRIEINKRIYEVIESNIIDRDYYCDIGRVVNIDNNGSWIKTKDGFLVVRKVRNIETREKEQICHLLKIGHRL